MFASASSIHYCARCTSLDSKRRKKKDSIVDEKLSLSIGNIIVYTNKTLLESEISSRTKKV